MKTSASLFKWATLFLLVMLVITLPSGCGRRGQKMRIAFAVKTLSNPFFIDMVEAAKTEANNHSDIELIIQSGERETDIERQVQIVENFITQKVAAICVTPCDSRGIIPAILKANSKRIPVLIIDTKIDKNIANEQGAKTQTFIGSDNYLGGRMAGEYLVKRLGGSGKVAILEGVPGQETAISRKSGFSDYMKQFSGMNIVTSQPADWNREKGLNVFQNMLQANPDIQALFACNDEMALGAIQAIRTAGKEGKISVVGFDATKDALDAIKSGYMDASVAQLPAEMGRLAISNAVKVLHGEKIPPEIPTRVELITKENIK